MCLDAQLWNGVFGTHRGDLMQLSMVCALDCFRYRWGDRLLLDGSGPAFSCRQPSSGGVRIVQIGKEGKISGGLD